MRYGCEYQWTHVLQDCLRHILNKLAIPGGNLPHVLFQPVDITVQIEDSAIRILYAVELLHIDYPFSLKSAHLIPQPVHIIAGT